MENQKIEHIHKHIHKNIVHKILAHSHFVFLLFFLVGVVLDLIFGFSFLNYSFIAPLGFVLLMFGTFLIFWAQKVSRNFKKDSTPSKEMFSKGPFRFTRTPTNFGLLFLVAGFGMIMNAFFIILTTIISFIVAKLVFLNKQEKILALKYGAPYLAYKKSVKL